MSQNDQTLDVEKIKKSVKNLVAKCFFCEWRASYHFKAQEFRNSSFVELLKKLFNASSVTLP